MEEGSWGGEEGGDAALADYVDGSLTISSAGAPEI